MNKRTQSLPLAFVCALIPLVALSITSAPPLAFAQGDFHVRTVRIISFNQIQGQSQWRQTQLNQIAGAQWVFYPNGRFSFTMPDVRDDLYPVQGTYQKQKGLFTFSGSSSSRTGSTGTASVLISGRLFTDKNALRVSMSLQASSGSVATIAGQRFSGGSATHYEFTVEVR